MKQRLHARDLSHRRVTAADHLRNFARDFGERFVQGSQRPSMVDFLLDSPFDG